MARLSILTGVFSRPTSSILTSDCLYEFRVMSVVQYENIVVSLQVNVGQAQSHILSTVCRDSPHTMEVVGIVSRVVGGGEDSLALDIDVTSAGPCTWIQGLAHGERRPAGRAGPAPAVQTADWRNPPAGRIYHIFSHKFVRSKGMQCYTRGASRLQ